MKIKSPFTIIRYYFRKPFISFIFIINIYILTVLFFISIIYPKALNVTVWLYDDVYVLENALRYYVDFRPGHPPLGKIPIHIIYMYSGGKDQSILAYNVVTFNICTITFYYLVKNLVKDEALAFKTSLFYVFNPAVIVALLQPHGDFLALFFTLLSILFILKKRICITAVSIALGFLTKIYTALLLIPTLIIVNNRVRVLLIVMFITTTWLISLPFLLFDPLMYASTFIHHLNRGPSESIIATLDGYFGHTGFIHPLFDATIYYYQFTKIYQPSPERHFFYAWKNPLLKYVALIYLLIATLPLCLYVFRRRVKREPVSIEKSFNLLILSFFTYLVLLPTQNILTHLPAYTLACIPPVFSFNKRYIGVITLYAIVNGFHAVSWSIFYSQVEIVLYVITNLRVLITALIFFLVTKQPVVTKL